MKNMRLKLARVEMNLSQEELAAKVNVLEGGKFNPSLQLCIRICKVLNKTLNDLFWEEDNL